MPPQNPFSTFADSNSFFGPNFLPRIGRSLYDFGQSAIRAFTPQAGTQPPTMAGVRVPSEGFATSNLNPVPFLQSLNPLANTPLIGGLAQGRSRQTEPPTPIMPTLPSGTPMVGFDAYPTIPQFIPPTQTKTVQTSQAAPAASAPQSAQIPTETTNSTVQTERRGLRTAYGMVYPTREQEAAAQQLAMRRPMEGRLQNIREQQVRPKFVEFAVNTPAPSGDPQKWLKDLNQAEKIQVMRERGRRLAASARQNMEQAFKQGSDGLSEISREENKASQANQSRSSRRYTSNGGQTTQRSWSNYTGNKRIKNFIYDEEIV